MAGMASSSSTAINKLIVHWFVPIVFLCCFCCSLQLIRPILAENNLQNPRKPNDTSLIKIFNYSYRNSSSSSPTDNQFVADNSNSTNSTNFSSKSPPPPKAISTLNKSKRNDFESEINDHNPYSSSVKSVITTTGSSSSPKSKLLNNQFEINVRLNQNDFAPPSMSSLLLNHPEQFDTDDRGISVAASKGSTGVGRPPFSFNQTSKPGVSVTIYHHQAILDPLANYGNGKPWNYLGHGYGLQYGFDMDGKNNREKGYQYVKAYGREFCKKGNLCKESSDKRPSVVTHDDSSIPGPPPPPSDETKTFQNHIFGLMKANNVNMDTWFDKGQVPAKLKPKTTPRPLEPYPKSYYFGQYIDRSPNKPIYNFYNPEIVSSFDDHSLPSSQYSTSKYATPSAMFHPDTYNPYNHRALNRHRYHPKPSKSTIQTSTNRNRYANHYTFPEYHPPPSSRPAALHSRPPPTVHSYNRYNNPTVGIPDNWFDSADSDDNFDIKQYLYGGDSNQIDSNLNYNNPDPFETLFEHNPYTNGHRWL